MAPKRRSQALKEPEQEEIPSQSSGDSERTESASDRSQENESDDGDFELKYCKKGEEEEPQPEIRRVRATTPRKRKQPETVKKPTKARKKQKKEAEETPTKRKKAEPTTKKKKTDKSPRKKKEGGAVKKHERNPKLPRVSTMQQKCTLFSFYCCIEETKKKVPDDSWDLLRHTCFWDFIKCFVDGKLDSLQIRKQESDLELILKHYNKGRQCFVFGGKEFRIRKEQIC